MPYRASQFIDFNTLTIIENPQILWNRRFMNPLQPPTLDDKLDVFECRVEVWQLGVAVAMLDQIEADPPRPMSVWSHAAYGMLTVVINYFEMIGKSLNPNSQTRGTAGDDFDAGFLDVYPTQRANVAQWRNRVRNGLYHLAYTKDELLIHGGDVPGLPQETFGIVPVQGGNWYYLNPHSLVREIVDHFPTFMQRLRDLANGAALRVKFQEFFDDFHAVP